MNSKGREIISGNSDFQIGFYFVKNRLNISYDWLILKKKIFGRCFTMKISTNTIVSVFTIP